MRRIMPLSLALWVCFGAACEGATIDVSSMDASAMPSDTDDSIGRHGDAHQRRGGDASGPDAEAPIVCPPTLPYASDVIAFEPGINAGTGQTEMPEVVLGPPAQGGSGSGSLDVLSLGVGGEIILSFGARTVLDGDGPDFVVWENPFWIGGDPANPFAELGEVSVSLDGETWHTYPCDPSRESGYDAGCAGWRPREDFEPCGVIPLVADGVGGDTFDLADLGLEEVRYIRIRDLAVEGAAPTAGFDLDAVGGIHLTP